MTRRGRRAKPGGFHCPWPGPGQPGLSLESQTCPGPGCNLPDPKLITSLSNYNVFVDVFSLVLKQMAQCCSYKVARRGVLVTNMILLIFAFVFMGVGGVSIGLGVFASFQSLFVILIGFDYQEKILDPPSIPIAERFAI